MKIKEKIFEAYHLFSRNLLAENGYNPDVADSPIRVRCDLPVTTLIQKCNVLVVHHRFHHP